MNKLEKKKALASIRAQHKQALKEASSAIVLTDDDLEGKLLLHDGKLRILCWPLQELFWTGDADRWKPFIELGPVEGLLSVLRVQVANPQLDVSSRTFDLGVDKHGVGFNVTHDGGWRYIFSCDPKELLEKLEKHL